MNYPRMIQMTPEQAKGLSPETASCADSGPYAGQWVPARPMGYPFWRYRLRAAWEVFTGRADAVVWPEDQRARENNHD